MQRPLDHCVLDISPVLPFSLMDDVSHFAYGFSYIIQWLYVDKQLGVR